jgi:hypothetical protein
MAEFNVKLLCSFGSFAANLFDTPRLDPFWVELLVSAYIFRHKDGKIVIPAKAGMQRYPGCRVGPGMTV